MKSSYLCTFSSYHLEETKTETRAAAHAARPPASPPDPRRGGQSAARRVPEAGPMSSHKTPFLI